MHRRQLFVIWPILGEAITNSVQGIHQIGMSDKNLEHYLQILQQLKPIEVLKKQSVLLQTRPVRFGIGFTVAVLISHFLLWPGGFGFWGGKSITLEEGSQGTTKITTTDPGKTLWDWLSLLGVPLSLAILGAWFQASQQKQANEEAREDVLQVYFDRLSTLLVDKNLLALAAKKKMKHSKIKSY